MERNAKFQEFKISIKPNKSLSRLPLCMNLYISIFSCASRQNPINSTRFLCCNLAINKTSFLNSMEPCEELCDNLFTAICSPQERMP